jgi:hypothetical protein
LLSVPFVCGEIGLGRNRGRIPRQTRRRAQSPPLPAKLHRNQHGELLARRRARRCHNTRRRRILHKAHLRPPDRTASARAASALVETSLVFMVGTFTFAISIARQEISAQARVLKGRDW